MTMVSWEVQSEQRLAELQLRLIEVEDIAYLASAYAVLID